MIRLKPLRKLNEHGLTFVELLIVVGLLAIFLTILVTIFTATISSQTQTEAYSAVTTDGRFMMARLDYDIAAASAITTPATLGGSGASLVMTVGGATYTYSLNGNNLQFTDGTGSANLNGSGTIVSAVSFQRIGNSGGKDTIRYSFTLTNTNAAHAGSSQTFTSTVGRRF